MRIDNTASGKAQHLHVGEALDISLEETLTTGYRWRLTSSCSDLLELGGEVSHRHDPTRPGAPARHIWTLVARRPGTCELRFESVRPWDQTATGKALFFPVTIVAAS